jgi:hypothetical protein
MIAGTATLGEGETYESEVRRCCCSAGRCAAQGVIAGVIGIPEHCRYDLRSQQLAGVVSGHALQPSAWSGQFRDGR